MTSYNGQNIYNECAGGGGGGEGLPIAEIYNFPSGYTPLDKLVFDGKAAERVEFPFTGYRANYNKTDNILELIAKINNVNVINSIFRYSPVSPNDNLVYNGSTSRGEIDFYSNNSFADAFIGCKNIVSEKFTIKSRYNKLWLNNSSANLSWLTQINTKDSVCICATAAETTRIAYMEIFSFKIYEPGGNIILFGVPAFDVANEKDGIFDLITSEFFEHKWYS